MYSVFKYEKELQKLIQDEENLDFFIDISQKYLRCNKDLYKEVFDEMLKFSAEKKLLKAEAWAYYYLGWYYFFVSDYYKAVDNFFISYDLFEYKEYKKGIVYACNGLNNAYRQLGQFKLAIEWGLKGISIAEEINEINALINLLLNEGYNYILLNDLKKAKHIYNTIDLQGYNLSEYQKIAYDIALAEIEINDGNAQKAIEILDISLQIQNESGLDDDLSETYKLKAMAYVKLNMFDKAKQEFNNSYEISEKTQDFFHKCSTMIEYSKLMIMLDEKEEAIELLKDVTKICSNNVLLMNSYNLLYSLNKKWGNYEEALDYLEKYMHLEKHMFDYEHNQLMAKMNVKKTEKQADLYKFLYDRTELLSSIGQKIISNLNFNSIIYNINEELNKLIHADVFDIALYDKAKDELLFNSINKNSQIINSASFKLNHNCYSYYCIKNKEDIIIGNASKEYKKYKNSIVGNNGLEQQEKSMIFTPLAIRDKVIGVMSVKSYKENSYDKNDLNTLKIIANYSAIAVDNAISFKKIKKQATHDRMTGFLTRSEIHRRGQSIYEKSKTNKFSIIMMDIDDFKLINDNFGHHAGDSAIALISKSIKNCIRSTDYIGRYGGDEFLLICPGSDKSKAIEVAERIRRTVSNKNYYLGKEIIVNITLSLGVYEFDDCASSFIDGVKYVDKYMYNAKLSSKNKVEY